MKKPDISEEERRMMGLKNGDLERVGIIGFSLSILIAWLIVSLVTP